MKTLNPVKRLSHCSCEKITAGAQPGWFERLLMLLIPHVDIVKTVSGLCPYCVLECDYCNGRNVKATVLYLRRFYLFRSKWLGSWLAKRVGDLYLHHIVRSDDDDAPHDHPWGFLGFVLAGGYVDEQWLWTPEHTAFAPEGWVSKTLPGSSISRIFYHSPGFRTGPAYENVLPLTFIRRAAEHIHRVLLVNGPAWTLIATSPYGRDWNFITENGPVFWRTYLGLEGAGDVGE